MNERKKIFFRVWNCFLYGCLSQWWHHCFLFKKSRVPFSTLPWSFFLVENYCSVFTNWALVLFVLCPCSVLCCLRRRLCTGLPTAQRSTSNCIRFPIFDPQYHPYPLTTPCKRNRRKWKCFFWERDYYSFVLSFWKHHDLGWDSITFTYVCEQWS